MKVEAIQTPLIRPGEALLPVLRTSLREPLEDGDVLCVASKVVALEQGRIVRLADIRPSAQARCMPKLRYSKDFDVYPELAELVLREAAVVFRGQGDHVYLTLKDNVLIASAGIDLSNAPEGMAILWPERPWEWARAFRERLRERYRIRRVGVIVTDSHLTPLRRGVTGFAVACAGFEPVLSDIGRPDLFGKPLRVTQRAVADGLATAAVLVTGEADECTPFARIRGASLEFTDREIDAVELAIEPRNDLYAGIYNEQFKDILGGTKDDLQ